MNIGIDRGNGDYSAVTFAKMGDDGVAVILASLTGEPADAFINLLRVARAAEDFVNSVREPPEPSNLAKSPVAAWLFVEELRKALKEVKDLL